MVVQAIGVALVAAGGWLLWSPWALVAGGLLLVVLPELVTRR